MDNETKHSPGPWSWGRDVDEAINVYFDDDGDGIPDAEVFASDAPDDNAEANVRLIIAAPDLLEAAEKALAWWHETPGHCWGKEPAWLPAIRAAITKATGE